MSYETCNTCGTQVVVIKKDYDELIKDQKKLRALESAGVDNWDGYDTALDILEDMEKK